ncbi:MAG TPA: UDP binding domain-containing protein, partial [Limnochordia bacterium]
ACAREADVVAVLTDHSAFRTLDPRALAGLMRQPIVYDARGCLDRARWEAAGFRVCVLGDGRTAARPASLAVPSRTASD